MATKTASKKGKSGKTTKKGGSKATKPAAAPAPAAVAPTIATPAPAPAPVVEASAPAVEQAPAAPKTRQERVLDKFMGDAIKKNVSQNQLDQLGMSRNDYHPLHNRIGRYKMSRGSMFDDFTISVA